MEHRQIVVYGLIQISGKLNSPVSSIEHFCDENRRFFAFSDTPHLMKCVRNRLYNNRVLKVKSITFK